MAPRKSQAPWIAAGSPFASDFLAEHSRGLQYAQIADGDIFDFGPSTLSAPTTGVLDDFNRGSLGGGWTVDEFGAGSGFPGVPVLDNFNRSDGGLGSNWTTDASFDGAAALRIVSNGVMGEPGGNYSSAWFNALSVSGSKKRVYVVITGVPTGDRYIEIGFVYGPGASTVDGYALDYAAGSSGLVFYKITNTSYAQLGASIAWTPSVGHAMCLEIDEDTDTLTAYTFDGSSWTTAGTRSDADFSGTAYPMLYMAGTMAIADDFGAGAVGTAVSAPTITGNELVGAVAGESNGWLNGASYSGTVDTYATLRARPLKGEHARLDMLYSPGASTTDAYQLRVTWEGAVWLYRVDNGAPVVLAAWAVGLGVGDGFWLQRNHTTGAMQVAYKIGAGSWTLAGTYTDATYTGAAHLGAGFTGTTAKLDNLGGGDVGSTPTYTGDIVVTAPTPEADVLGLFTPPTYAGLIEALAPTPGADLAGAHVPPTYSGDVVAAAPTPVADLTGSYTQPLYTADIAAAAPLPSADLTGAHVPPTYSGDIAATAPTPTADASGAFTPALYTADIVATVPTPIAEIVGAQIPPTYAGDVVANAPTPVAILDGSHVPQVYTGDIVATAPMPGAVLVGDQLPPAYVASVDVLLPLPVAELIGTFAGELYTAVIAATVPTPTADVTGGYTQPTYAADIAATAPLPTADLAGTHTPPVYAGDIVATAPLPTADVVGSFAGALYSGEISATAPLPVVVITGAHVPPSYAGDVSAVAPTPVAVVNGSFAAPVYSADIAAVVPLPDAVASGLFSAPTYIGDIVAMVPMPTAELTGSYSTFVAPLVVRITRKMLARFMAKRMPV